MIQAADSSECLSRLLKYPQVQQIGVLVDLALNLKAKHIQKKEEEHKKEVERKSDVSTKPEHELKKDAPSSKDSKAATAPGLAKEISDEGESSPESPDKKHATNWMAQSLRFFNPVQSIKLPSEQKKVVKSLTNDVKPVNKSVLDKVATCIEALRKENDKYRTNHLYRLHNNPEIGRIILMLQDVEKELK